MFSRIAAGLIFSSVSLCWALVTGPAAQPAFSVEDVSFPTIAQPAFKERDKSVKVTGNLYVPKNAKPPMSVMVILHSSSGVKDYRERYYAEELAKQGIAALIVDSYGPRGVKTTMYDQAQVVNGQLIGDSYGALRFLAGDKRFDSKRIGVMGVSKGGSASLEAAFDDRRTPEVPSDLQFAVHVPIGAPCNAQYMNVKNSGKPIRIMVGDKDDMASPTLCQKYVDRIKEAGNKNVSLRIYPNVGHAWENTGKAGYDPKEENNSNCRMFYDNKGNIELMDTHKRMSLKDYNQWKKTNCLTYGAKAAGGSESFKARATEEIIDYLKENGFGPSRAPSGATTSVNRSGYH